MLTNRDYKTMLEAGVDAGLLAIVESAFKVLFEAGVKTLANPMKALPLDSVVDALGIDISDCTSEDGKVNWNSVSRKPVHGHRTEGECYRSQGIGYYRSKVRR